MREFFSIPFEGCTGLKRFVFLLMVLLTVPGALGAASLCELGLALLNAAPRIQAVNVRMRKQIVEPNDAIRKLRKTSSFLGFKDPVLLNTGALEQKGDSVGNTNAGIYEVTLPTGEIAVVKLVPAEAYNHLKAGQFGGTQLVHPNFSGPVLIQQALAELGMAPRLLAVIPYRETLRWMGRMDIQMTPGIQGTPVALVMEKLENPWNVSKSTQVPAELAGFSKEKLSRMIRRIKEIEHTLEKLGVNAVDSQVFVCKGGEVKLGDLDLYTLLKPGEKRESFNYHIETLVRSWEAASGQTYPAAELQALKAFELVTP